MAKEEKRHPKARTRPPITAVSRVDLRLHTPTVKGEKMSPKDSERPPRAPETKNGTFDWETLSRSFCLRKSTLESLRPLKAL